MKPEDFHTKTWARLEAVLVQRLVELREQNDRNQDNETTAHLRGRIAEVKRLLALRKSASEAAGENELPI